MNAAGGDRFAMHCDAVRKLLNRHMDQGLGIRDQGLSHDGYRVDLDAGCPLPAIKIANFCGIRVGSHDESKKKGVRNCIEKLRENGMRICADSDGYWLARDDAEWHAYQESRKSDAKFTFVRVAQMKKAAGEAAVGQTLLPDESGLAWARA